MRRLTRLEPPYMLAILLLFFLKVFNHESGFTDLLPGLGSSLIYLHNVIHGYDKLITVVAWSLEIEVQFYLLAPFLSYIFYLKKSARRVVLIISVIFFSIIQNLFPLPFGTIYTFIQFFLVGFLLVDFYIDSKKYIPGKLLSIISGILLLFVILYSDHHEHLYTKLIFTIAIFGFYYLVLNQEFWRRLFSSQLIAVIGGMCYSIYLLHHIIISTLYHYLSYFRIFDYYLPNLVISTIICYSSAVIFSSVFFKLIERPCMDKHWPGKLMEKLKIH